ncbi:hypothetical protein Psesu_0491 [Pseudoxanthomonas suwonensis 11-1]|uniref:DUF4124 domain-containing protein n=1 Tax=Pseudoxanthomonas suwonensis (strain 11-1) TaxID=743721 RepID=E6WQA0_PSEUU|nr:hypothetical protein [Pseudoxanthomonas suwonensis]ADV26349.1 hypothetical protein Psesu_0491 [Pseudoxanthomonas suwonensis 11-1]
MSRRTLLLPCIALALLPLCDPAPASAQGVRRCTDAAGRSVFTDQRCSDLGAVERVPEGAQAYSAAPMNITGAVASPRGPSPGGCPRTPTQLASELGRALIARDSNRLASMYDWSGVSGTSASKVLGRLEQLAARPLVDIAPVLAEVAPAPPVPAVEPVPEPLLAETGEPPQPEASRWLPDWIRVAPADSSAGAGTPDDGPLLAQEEAVTVASLAPEAPPPPRTVGLRVEQTLPGSATPARTVFGMERRYGCLWLRF